MTVMAGYCQICNLRQLPIPGLELQPFQTVIGCGFYRPHLLRASFFKAFLSSAQVRVACSAQFLVVGALDLVLDSARLPTDIQTRTGFSKPVLQVVYFFRRECCTMVTRNKLSLCLTMCLLQTNSTKAGGIDMSRSASIRTLRNRYGYRLLVRSDLH